MPIKNFSLQRSEKKKKQVIKILAVGFFLLTISMVGCVNSQQAGEIDVDQAFQLYQEGVFILDVREPDEWNEHHIPGATLIPLGELESRINEIPQDQEIVVVCRSGNRSQTGRDILLEAGFTNISSMAGGVNAWIASGYEIVTGP